MYVALCRLYGLLFTFVYRFVQYMQLCVGCTDFAHVCVRLCTLFAALRRLYDFFCTLVYGFYVLSGLCACIQLLRIKHIVHTDTAFAR